MAVKKTSTSAAPTDAAPETENVSVPEQNVEATNLVVAGITALDGFMDEAEGPGFEASDAGLGSEDIGQEHILLPRVQLLQSMSKAITEVKVEGAKPGSFMLSPFNRVLSDPDSTNRNVMEGLTPGVRMVVVRIYPTQRMWRSLDDGGGIICEAPSGDLVANEAKGCTGAALQLTCKKGKVIDVDWEGGTPTADCHECVFGPAAAAAAAGQAPGKRGNPWLPKRVEWEGEMLDLPDDKRAPKCTQGIDVLALLVAPAYNGAAAQVTPAFLTFTRSSYAAGRQLSSMIKMATNEPAWASIFELGVKSVTNDKGTFFVVTSAKKGYANKALADMAKELFNVSAETSYRPDLVDEEGHAPSSSVKKDPSKTVDVEPANVEDEF